MPEWNNVEQSITQGFSQLVLASRSQRFKLKLIDCQIGTVELPPPTNHLKLQILKHTVSKGVSSIYTMKSSYSDMTIEELQPYFSAAGAILGFATFGFLLRLTSVIRTADRAWGETKEEQRKLAESRTAFFQEVSQEKTDKLNAENEALRAKLEEALSTSGITIDSIITGRAISQVSSELSKKIDDLINKMENVERHSVQARDPQWHLELAKGHMARRRWSYAAEHFDAYVSSHPSDFRSQLSRGVAFANIRGGETTNLSALRAYNEAIAFANETTEDWMSARLFIYRGAMLKRLDRLEESEADLLIGKSRATENYELMDVEYNLACIYAMKNDRSKLFETLVRLTGANRELKAINNHLDDYFANFSTDQEFLSLIGAN